MKRSVPVAVVMSIVMLLSMLASCSSVKKENDVVKEDDPWYESTRFKLDKAVSQNDELSDSVICTSDDRIFSVYCFSGDRWGSSRTVIDTYDNTGTLINRQDVICPELENSRIVRVYSLSADPDGKNIEAIIHLMSAGQGGAVFADIDTETGIVSNIKEVFGKEATKAKRSEASISTITGMGDYAVAVLDYYSGYTFGYQLLLFKNTEFISELDLSTVNLNYLYYGFSIDPSANSLYAAGTADGEAITMEFDMANGKLKNTKSFQMSDDTSINFAEYTATDKGDLVKIDSLGNIVKLDVNTMTPKTVVDTNWYTPYFSSLDTDQSTTPQISSCSENRTVIKDIESTAYGCDEYVCNEYVRILMKADKNPNASKKIIELALPPNSGVTDYLARTIYEFNKTDNEYLIRVWDKYKTGFVVGRAYGDIEKDEQEVFKMIQDLKGDDAPDIAIGIQKNYAMRDDVFMDLTDFLDPEVLDKQYSNIFEAGRINGKLYFLPVTLEIDGLVTNEDLLEDGAVGITFEEYDDLVNGEMHGFSPYDYPTSMFYNKRSFVLSCIDTKSAIEGENISFGTDQFRAAVEYAKDNFEYDDETSIPHDYLDDWTRYRGECYYAEIGDYLDFVHACCKTEGYYKIIGTPSVDASGPRFKALETISVSATTDMKDGCRKFLNFLFSGAAVNSGKCEFRQIVTNREIMRKNVESLNGINNKAYDRYMASIKSGAIIPSAGMDKVTGDKAATEDMAESFLNSLSTISTYYYEDYTIVKFTLEELAPYYAGDRSLDDAIRYLNDRTTKYIREM